MAVNFPLDTDDGLWSTRQVAEYLGVDRSWVPHLDTVLAPTVTYLPSGRKRRHYSPTIVRAYAIARDAERERCAAAQLNAKRNLEIVVAAVRGEGQ